MTYAAMMIDKYRSRKLLLDSNLLLLYLASRVDATLIGTGSYNKLSSFKVHQIIILEQLILHFKGMVTTAHILTEVSNLVNTMHDAAKQKVFSAFAQELQVFTEENISSYQVAQRREFRYLGLTDSVLAELAGKFLVVSNDAVMVDMLRQTGIEALKWVEVLGLSE